MLYYLSVAGIVLHTFFWGAGLAWLVLPRRWQRWWWAFAPGVGIALQSGVVWAGAHTTLAGTDRYAWGSEALPAVLLGAVVWRAGLAATLLRLRHLRALIGVAVAMLAAGWLLVSPMTKLGRGLTSSSLGSCDHADYAAGARVLKEFASTDRTGFLGLPEVTWVQSARYFFDFWLRLNHFTPPALIAHNGTILGIEPHRLVSVTAAALLLLNLPIVLFLARVAVGLRRWPALAVVALYAVSPLGGYAVHIGGLGQLLGAQGVALLTLAALGAYREVERRTGPVRGDLRRLWPFAALALVGFWVLAGSYNFILTVALAPAVAWMLGRQLLRRDGRALLLALGTLAAALAVCVLFFGGRFAGMQERFWLFDQYNFGWPVATLTPEGWLGLVATPDLQAWPLWFRLPAGAAVLGAVAWAVVGLGRRQRATSVAALALVLPVIAGWGLLTYQAATRANASYDAFKLLSVFYPGLLAGLCVWLRLDDPRNVLTRCLVVACTVTLLTGNLMTADALRERMQNPPLRVDRALVDLSRLERNERIRSLNMRIDDFWSRLWANAFLLRKPQYFPTHTYEGRKNTALKGEWDLRDSMLRALPVNDADFVIVNPRYHVVRRAAPGFVEVQFGEGWHQPERFGAERWRWDAGDGILVLNNPAATPVHARLALKARAINLRQVALNLNGTVAGRCVLDEKTQDVVFPDIVVPPGRSTLIFASSEPARQPADGDARRLSVGLYGFDLRALGPGPGSPSAAPK